MILSTEIVFFLYATDGAAMLYSKAGYKVRGVGVGGCTPHGRPAAPWRPDLIFSIYGLFKFCIYRVNAIFVGSISFVHIRSIVFYRNKIQIFNAQKASQFFV